MTDKNTGGNTPINTDNNAEPQNLQQLVELINNPFYYIPPTLDEGYEDFFQTMDRINPADRTAAMTATIKLVNAIALQIQILRDKEETDHD